MIYTFKYNDATLEFDGNNGKAIVPAPGKNDAISSARLFFAFMRDPVAVRVDDKHYEIHFKVALDYQQSILRRIDRIIKKIRCQEDYANAIPLERYLIVSMKRHSGRPDWLGIIDLVEETRKQRQDAVVTRNLRNISEFLDWDICLHNYIELNSRHRHRSRSIRDMGESAE